MVEICCESVCRSEPLTSQSGKEQSRGEADTQHSQENPHVCQVEDVVLSLMCSTLIHSRSFIHIQLGRKKSITELVFQPQNPTYSNIAALSDLPLPPSCGSPRVRVEGRPVSDALHYNIGKIRRCASSFEAYL